MQAAFSLIGEKRQREGETVVVKPFKAVALLSRVAAATEQEQEGGTDNDAWSERTTQRSQALT
jgi:hypothetical protein